MHFTTRHSDEGGICPTGAQRHSNERGINGQLVKQIALPGGNANGQVQINKNEFRKGSYVMSLINGNNELQSKTFIVQ